MTVIEFELKGNFRLACGKFRETLPFPSRIPTMEIRFHFSSGGEMADTYV